VCEAVLSAYYPNAKDGSVKKWPSWVSDTETVKTLIAAGSVVNSTNNGNYTPFHRACQEGQSETVAALITAGAEVNSAGQDGSTPLHLACYEGDNDMVAILLTAGAKVNQVDNGGFTPLYEPCRYGHLEIVQILSSYGADWQVGPDGQMATDIADIYSQEEIITWLSKSRQWTTPLHHLCIVDATHARSLLREGADLHVAASPDGPTPLSLAQSMEATGDVTKGSTAQLVLDAAKPWSKDTHSLFPSAARKRAAMLLRIGWDLSQQERFTNEEMAIFEVLQEHVMPHAIMRNLQ
jgi:hypothetical protein